MNSGDITFRPAVIADALCVSALGMQVFLTTYATQGMRPVLAREAREHFSLGKIEALVRDESVSFILAESAGHLVGFVQVTHGARHVLVSHEPASELDRLYVHERFTGTGTGIGKALLQRAEALAASRGAAALWLTAWVGNARAIGFYPRQGYMDVGATDYVFENGHYENRVYFKELS